MFGIQHRMRFFLFDSASFRLPTYYLSPSYVVRTFRHTFMTERQLH